MRRLRNSVSLGKLIRALVILTFVIMGGTGFALVRRVSSLSDDMDKMIRAENDQSEWTTTQISVELYRFQLEVVQYMEIGDLALLDQIKHDFDILYARLSQIQERHFHEIFGKYDRLDILTNVTAQRDHMAEIIDRGGVLSTEDAKQLINHAEQAVATWRGGTHYVLQETRAERVNIRQNAALKIAKARNSLVGALVGLVAVGISIATLSKLRVHQAKRMSELANKDPLTGCLSRRGIEQVMAQIPPHSLHRWSVVVVDLDGLKAINDTYGHAAGDKAIMTAGQILSGAVREGDIVGRIGGDEFWLALKAHPSDAENVLLRAEKELNETAFEVGGASLQLSLSFGVAGCAPGVTLTDSFEAADNAMYIRKTAKRKRAV